jgi:hypothetical protein
MEMDDLPTNWGRWGERDERGTLNLITDEVRARAVTEARTGRTVSISRPMPAPSSRGHTRRSPASSNGRPSDEHCPISRPRLLLVNDDGVGAIGLQKLQAG